MRFLGFAFSFLFTSAAFAHGVGEADKHRMIEGGIFDYLALGAKHMITGYDHLLFLFGVIFFLTKFKDIVKFITAFTIGHSITLIFATFTGITANEYLVDAVIALTVIYKGFDNIDGFKRYLKMNSPNLIALVFIFGLIHGFGLSTRLQQLPLGSENLLAKIVSFNVGVEIGQVVALSIMSAVLAGWRKTNSFKQFGVAANVGLMLAGTALLIYQLMNFAKDDHHDEATHGEQSHAEEAQEGHSHGGEMHSHDEESPAQPTPQEHGHSNRHEGEHQHISITRLRVKTSTVRL